MKKKTAKTSQNPEAVKALQTIIPDVVPPGDDLHQTLLSLAKSAVEAATEAMGKYWDLVKFARDNQIPPAQLRLTLKQAGFVDSRVSEVIKVCSAPPVVFKEYEERRIGFRLALKRAREEDDKKKGRKRKQPSEEELFTSGIIDFLEAYIPIVGDVPLFTCRPFMVNGRKVILQVEAKA
jgi:hypothetical protein